MKNKTIMKKIICVMAAFLLSLFAIFESVLSITPYKAYAEDSATEEETTESKYTDVLEDLQKDGTFNIEEYPVNTSIDEMTVIQIAESSDKELFVYVYQANTDLNYLADEIRLGFPVVNVQTNYKDYALTLISRNGVFSKYLVEHVTILDDVIRYYDIVQLSRSIDGETSDNGTGNVINSVVYDVSQKWTVYTLNGSVFYDMTYLETIAIEDKYVGYCRYEEAMNGLFGISTHYDSHFLAFSTSYPVDAIKSATLSFMYQTYTYRKTGFKVFQNKFSDPVKKEVTIKAEDYATVPTAGWWWEEDYDYPRISTVEDFLVREEDTEMYKVGLISSTTETKITDETKKELENKQWVFRFFETSYNRTLTTDFNNLDYERISEVTVLQLEYDLGDYTYSVGVVDNKISEGEKQDPSNSSSTTVIIPEIDFSGIEEAFKKIMTVFGGIIIVALLGVIISVCAPVLGSAFKLLFKGLTWSLSLPFKLLDKLFKKK